MHDASLKMPDKTLKAFRKAAEKMAQKMADEAAELRKAAHALEFAQVELFSASATVVPTTLELNVPRASRCVSICPDLPACCSEWRWRRRWEAQKAKNGVELAR